MNVHRLVATGVSLLLTSSVVAQPQEPAAPLVGPKVVEAKQSPRPTLVHYDFDGRVIAPQPTPEEAAVALLNIDDAAKERVRTLLRERSRVLDGFVAENLELLGQLEPAEAAGDKKTQFAIAYRAYLELRPLWKDGPLEDQVRAALPEDARPQFDALLKEYWSALVKERRRTPKPDGKLPSRVEVLAEAKIQSLGKELEQSFHRIADSGELIFQYLMKGIELRPDQVTKLRELAHDYAQQTKMDATDKQNVAFFMLIIPILDEEQRKQFVKNVKGGG